MRTFMRLAIVLGIIAALVGASAARERSDQRRIRIKKPWSPEKYAGYDIPAGPGAFQSTATVDTYTVVHYDFETKNWQGWTRRDNAAQQGGFFHVDDFAGLGGGVHGLLAPIQGTKSMWCGVRPNPNDPYVCNWEYAPGYGNNWDQNLATAISVTGPLTLSYHLVYDTEPGYDFVRVQNADYPSMDEVINWQDLAVYTGSGDTVASHTIYTTRAQHEAPFPFRVGQCVERPGRPVEHGRGVHPGRAAYIRTRHRQLRGLRNRARRVQSLGLVEGRDALRLRHVLGRPKQPDRQGPLQRQLHEPDNVLRRLLLAKRRPGFLALPYPLLQDAQSIQGAGARMST